MRTAALLFFAVTLASLVACGDEDLRFGEEQDTPVPTASTPSSTATPTPTVTPEPTTGI